MALALTLKVGEAVEINGPATLVIRKTKGKSVTIAFITDPNVKVLGGKRLKNSEASKLPKLRIDTH